MPKSPVDEFQQELGQRLRTLFPGVPVKTEWATMRDENGLYSPRLDLAVGPFAVQDNVYVAEFDRLLETHYHFVQRLYDLSVSNLKKYDASPEIVDIQEAIHRNANARCFLAIEIENQVNRKHLMGGAINAAALGRLGLAVGWTPDKVKAFVRLRRYLLFLANVKKNTFSPHNLLVLSKDQLRDAVLAFAPKATKPGKRKPRVRQG